MWITGREKFEDERFPWLDFNGDLFAGSQAVIKRGRGKNADIRIGLSEFVVLCEHIRIEKITQEVVRAHRVTQFFLERGGCFGKVNGFETCARAAFQWSGSAKDYFLQFARPSAGRNSKDTGKHFNDGVRERKIVLLVELEQIGWPQLVGH